MLFRGILQAVSDQAPQFSSMLPNKPAHVAALGHAPTVETL
jgi:hypothetical protein